MWGDTDASGSINSELQDKKSNECLFTFLCVVRWRQKPYDGPRSHPRHSVFYNSYCQSIELRDTSINRGNQSLTVTKMTSGVIITHAGTDSKCKDWKINNVSLKYIDESCRKIK
jgi:hypothetical protein